MINESYRCGSNNELQDSSLVEASFSFPSAARCADCGELRALRLPALKPVCLRSVDQFSHAGSNQTYNKGQPLTFSSQNNASFSPSTPLYRRSQRLKDRSLSTMEVARAVEEDLPSYYEHLSISLLVPESPEEAPSPNCRRKPLSPALPLPDHMAPIGEFLDSVTAYVEVRTNLGDHSGSLAALLYRMGASIAASLNPSVTHAVLSNARPATMKRAASLGIRMVAARWAMSCMDELRKVEEDQWPVVTQATQDEQRRIRQYRYQTNSLRDQPSPVSISNLARLSKQRRRTIGGTPSNNSTTSRGLLKSTLPRKSLRRMLFENVNADHNNVDSDISDGSYEESERGSEVTVEIPETQTGLLSQVHGVNVWVPETESLLCSANRCEHHFKDSEDIEILETQLESSNSKQKAMVTFDVPGEPLTSCDSTVTVTSNRRASAAQGLPPLIHNAKSNEEQFDTLEASFEEPNVTAEWKSCLPFKFRSLIADTDFTHDLTKMFSGVSIGSDKDRLHSEENSFRLELPSDLSQSQGRASHSGIERDQQVISTEGCITFDLQEELHEPITTNNDKENVSSWSDRIIRRIATKDASLECFAEDTPAASEEIGLLNDDEIRGYSIRAKTLHHNEVSGMNAGLTSKQSLVQVTEDTHQQRNEKQEKLIHNRRDDSKFLNCSEAMLPIHVDGRQCFVAGTESNDDENSGQGIPPSRCSEDFRVPSSGLTSDLSTPLSTRKARISGVFSDDESPCIDTRRTVVLTAVKNKASLIHSLLQLANKTFKRRTAGEIGPLTVGEEVTTKTEVVVLGRRRRTLSVLLGIGWGCWFVDIRWVRACIQEDRWLDPAPFEITDFLPPMVINRASKNGHTHESRPLEGVTVFISRKRPLKPTAENLQRMVLQAAGKIVFDVCQADVYVGRRRPAKKLRCPSVNPYWIIETVATGFRQCEHNFLL
ncbi:microcephalin-like isoform X3 [Varroa jacobsoni]|uniref:microcephalin-like isoform X3 n=1 Tax=Varroa jacobsoni TaxID=62625 RepID=UPI000BF37AF9|nr:microcephalin-like isoform X3 [Varroa jacobsoni]